jgi:acyl-CoA synthetase (AMP-forming)/AMP-acid ligase II
VIGVPDARFIEAVAAVVVLADGQDLDALEVVSWCAQHLASYKKPRHVFFIDELPRTASGKIIKYRLRERFASQVGGDRP